MRNAPRRLIPWLILLMVASCGLLAADEDSESWEEYLHQGKDEGVYWPTKGWKTASPEVMGMDSQKLVKAIEYAADPRHKTDGVAVVKNGHIVAEAYLGDFGQDSTHISYSMAKSFSSALVGIAIDQGLIPDVDAKLCQYFDEWACDDEKRNKASIRHVLTLTTGLKWHEDWVNFDPDTNDAVQMVYSGDYLGYVLGREAVHEPGEFFTYSTGDPMLLSGVIAKATGMSALQFAKENLFQPLGISSVRWDSDEEGYTGTFSELHLTVRDYAKFGYLYLNQGRWEGRQIVSEEWVATSTRTDPSVRMWDAYGYLWHVNLPLRLDALNSDIPADGYMAQGIMGQSLIIIPSRDLVIVTVSSAEDGGLDLVRFLTLVLDAIEDEG
jgi:CubicO group peptidase (beta-lactamase class C family)